MDEINVQTQNFNADNIGSPEQPKNKTGLIISIIVAIIVIIIIGGGAYYFLTASKNGAPVITEQTQTPTTLPQVTGPQTPPPGPSDELGDISSDLNAIDLNALDASTASDTASIGNAL